MSQQSSIDKPPKPDWRLLRRRIERVAVKSCSDGTLRIEPVWREGWAFQAEPDSKPIPGLFTRWGAAEELERLLNRALRAERRTVNLDTKIRIGTWVIYACLAIGFGAILVGLWLEGR